MTPFVEYPHPIATHLTRESRGYFGRFLCLALQSNFKKDLMRNVKQFVMDVMSFRNDWEANGPTVPGITPMQGHERLQRFKRSYDDKKRRWEEYRAGEELFGLAVTDYPELSKTKKEIDLLEKVYSLYLDVTTTVSEYKDLLWTDVPSEINGMLAKARSPSTQPFYSLTLRHSIPTPISPHFAPVSSRLRPAQAAPLTALR